MRKLQTKDDIKRIQRRNNIILGLVMIVLLVGSSLGYSLMSAEGDSSNRITDMGYDFVRDAGLWKMSIQGQVFSFQNLPSSVADVDVNISSQLGTYSGQPLYFVNPGEGVSEILLNIDRYILRYQEACLDSGNMSSIELDNETECEGDLPIKDCSSNVIIFEEGDETMVYSQDNCVFIVGDSLRGSDAFLYEVLGIR